ncbi:MAG: ABC transporter permease subunit [Sporolactobacillus sp.]
MSDRYPPVSVENQTKTGSFQASNRFKEILKKFLHRKLAVVAACFILFLLLMAIFGPQITPYNPAVPNYNHIMEGPEAQHLLGTDEYGRDVLSRLLVGTRLSLGVSVSSVIIGAVLGTILGVLAGFYGGLLETLVMRGSDVLFAFPDILLAIAVVAIIGPGIINVVIAVAVFTVPSFARIMRGAVLSVKGALYVQAARSIGCTNARILWVHVFPGTFQSMVVNFTMRIGTAILAAASLSFLGFGANVTEPDWGAMLSSGRNYIGTASYLVYFPGMLIFFTVLAFNLLGDGLQDALDPKIK